MRPLIFLLLLGVTCARSVPLTSLPEIVLGLYEAIPESEDNHFDELTHIFQLPVAVTERERSLAGFHKQGDSFRQYFISADHLYSAYFPFKLNQKQNGTINGRVAEYEFTSEGDNHGATIRAAFREVNGGGKFNVVATFDSDGYNATYTAGDFGSVAKRSYRRILPGYVFGAFEPDLSQSSHNVIDFYNNIFAPPKGFSWSKDSKFYFVRFDDKFCKTAIVDPMSTLYYKTDFQLNREQAVTHGSHTVESKHEIINSSPNSTTVRITSKTAKGTFVITCVHDRAGFTCTTVTDKGEVKSRYSRVMPWFFYGKFEEVPEMTENYEKFLEDGSCPFDNHPHTLDMYRTGDRYGARKTYSNGTKMDFEFKLDSPEEFQIGNNTYKFSVTAHKRRKNDVILETSVKLAGTDKKYIVEEIAAPDGIYVKYIRGNVVAKKFMRRLVSKTATGTFESDDLNEEFKAFANHIGAPEMARKVPMEFFQAKDGTFVQKIAHEGDPVHETQITFGKPEELTVHGKKLEQTWFYYEMDNTPILHGKINQTDNAHNYYEITGVFRSDGFTATFIYDNKSKVARRNFVRKGAAVPFQPIHQKQS